VAGTVALAPGRLPARTLAGLTAGPVFALGGIPPGMQLQAFCVFDGIEHQMRLLGDEDRGFLLSGTIPEYDQLLGEIWFGQLDDAFAAATRLGIPRDGWSAVSAVEDVRSTPSGQEIRTTMPSVDVVAIFTAQEGSGDELGALLSTLVAPSQAEAANLRYELRRVTDAQPARFVVTERWASAEGFAEHRVSAHMASFRGAVAPLLAGPSDVLILEEL
jgi:quinol monooxygenase YgiN